MGGKGGRVPQPTNNPANTASDPQGAPPNPNMANPPHPDTPQ